MTSSPKKTPKAAAGRGSIPVAPGSTGATEEKRKEAALWFDPTVRFFYVVTGTTETTNKKN